MTDTVIAYKAFEPDFSCRGHKFEVGASYTVEGKVAACENGFHACEAPFDVLAYYPLVTNDGSFSRFGQVTLSGEMDRRKGDTKIAAASIAVDVELCFSEFVKVGIDWLIAATKGKKGTSGSDARIGSSGSDARIGSSGDRARIGSSGDGARIGSSGYGARIGSSGDGAQIGSSGYGARIKAEGANAVIASAGGGTVASGKAGTWISLAEFDRNGLCIGFATGCIGHDGLKPDTMYHAKGGKLVEWRP